MVCEYALVCCTRYIVFISLNITYLLVILRICMLFTITKSCCSCSSNTQGQFVLVYLYYYH